MVDISSGDNKINITVSTSGNKASVNATPDTAMYYSNKSREWAISDKIVDGEDYSSKYYANESKKQAETVKDKIIEVNSAVAEGITNIINQENISVDNVNTAGETQVNLATEQATIATTQAGIATAKTSEVVERGNNAITAITEQETTSKNNIITKGAEQIELIQNEGATQVANVQSTGFYMRDDKLYFINSQGEETEFKSDDIARIDEQLATKTDMLQASGAGMPSNKVINLTLGASGSTYTAPANGWFAVRVPFTANQACTFFNVNSLLGSQCTAVGQWTGYTSIPANKGDVIALNYNCTPNVFRFIYAEGSQPTT